MYEMVVWTYGEAIRPEKDGDAHRCTRARTLRLELGDSRRVTKNGMVAKDIAVRDVNDEPLRVVPCVLIGHTPADQRLIDLLSRDARVRYQRENLLV